MFSLVPRGTCMATPECSKWIFFSCSTMGRDHTVHGFQFRSDVVAANDQNQVISAVVAVCHLRDVYTLTEQPSDSDFFGYPAWREAMKFTKALVLETCLQPYGHEMRKDEVLVTTMPPWVDALLVRARPQGRVVSSKKPGYEEFYSKREKKGKPGQTWVSGGKKLSASEHFPTKFAQAIATAVVRLAGVGTGLSEFSAV